MAATSKRVRDLREGKIALVVRIVWGLPALAPLFTQDDPWLAVMGALLNIVLAQLVITIPIWFCKLTGYAFARARHG